MARVKSELRTSRRQLILDTAEQLFIQLGYEKTTLDDIAKTIGITRSLIYLEFSGKEKILFALVEGIATENLGKMRDIAKKSTLSRLETLKEIILFNILFAYDKSSQYFCPVTLVTLHQRIRAELKPLADQKQQIFYELLKDAAKAHEIPKKRDYQKVASLLSEVLLCFMPPNNLKYTREQIHQDASELFQYILNGLTLT